MPDAPPSSADPSPPLDWQGFVATYADTLWRTCARATRDPEEGRDVAAEVLRRLAERWPALLERWNDGGPASFRTWLAVVVRHLAIDVLRSLHGRFELPRAVARRHDWQQRLYCLLHRDGLPLLAAREVLLGEHPELAEVDLAAVAAEIERELPGGPRGRRRADVPLSHLADDEGRTPEPVDEGAAEAQDLAAADQTRRHLGSLLGELSGDERSLLRLYFLEGLSAAELLPLLGGRTRSQVYNRIHAVTAKLRRRAAEQGLGPGDLPDLRDGSWATALASPSETSR